MIKVGTRKSPLALAQVREILDEIRAFKPDIEFELVPVETMGDRDHSTSLRSLDKTDFFTREIDRLLLSFGCQIAIHSAKDLPDPLPADLCIAAMTKGVDPSDSLVLREGVSFEQLPRGAVIATSSKRREETVASLRPDLTFVDIRGNIGQRLQKLYSCEVDGVVIAEAALIRLNLHPNRIPLPGETALHQGRLAIVCRAQDQEMVSLFSVLHFEPSLGIPGKTK